MSLLTNFQDLATAVNVALDRIKATIAKKADKTELSAVARSGNYSDLKNKPTFSAVATSGQYYDLQNTPSLATVAMSGNYNDLNYRPSLSAVASSGSYNDLSDKPTYAAVASSGSYTDLSNKPDIFEIFPVYISNVSASSVTLSESWEDILTAFQSGKRVTVFASGGNNHQGTNYTCELFYYPSGQFGGSDPQLTITITYVFRTNATVSFVDLVGLHTYSASPTTTWTNTTTALN